MPRIVVLVLPGDEETFLEQIGRDVPSGSKWCELAVSKQHLALPVKDFVAQMLVPAWGAIRERF